MDTALEAVLRALLNSGMWAENQDGNSEAPTGYFGAFIIEPYEVPEIAKEFGDVIATYGMPAPDELTGMFAVTVNSQGVLNHGKYDDRQALESWWDTTLAEFNAWEDQDGANV